MEYGCRIDVLACNQERIKSYSGDFHARSLGRQTYYACKPKEKERRRDSTLSATRLASGNCIDLFHLVGVLFGIPSEPNSGVSCLVCRVPGTANNPCIPPGTRTNVCTSYTITTPLARTAGLVATSSNARRVASITRARSRTPTAAGDERAE